MTEALLHYAWRMRYYDAANMLTTQGHAVQVQHPGQPNPNQGPDFLQAAIQLGSITLHGHVEMHVLGDDWARHGHQHDPAYNSVVLHVVGSPATTPQQRADGTLLPELVLGTRLHASLVGRHDMLRQAQPTIACTALLPQVPAFTQHHWVQTLGWQRMLDKAEAMAAQWQQQHDWYQLFWVALAGMYGGPVNKAAFVQLAERIPYATLRRYANDLTLLEALLFGGAGMLTDIQDDYQAQLAHHWQHLAHKHQLVAMQAHQFHYARMRPQAFPSLRLAQLAALLHRHPSLLDVLDLQPSEVYAAYAVPPSAYWRTHYQFAKPVAARSKIPGRAFLDVVLVNVVVPFAILYHRHRADAARMEAQLQVLQQLRPEHNHVVQAYVTLGLRPADALESQGLLQLHKFYCTPRQCLQCAIGHHLFKHNDA